MKSRTILSLVLILLSVKLTAIPQTTKFQQFDSTSIALNDTISSLVHYNSDYMANTEIEHQKLMRNIFAMGFIFMLALLIFTVLFYGKKIKKVSNIIVLQNEVLSSTKDQLIKIINLFNYLDRQVYITDSKGIIEWHNLYVSNWFTEDYEKNKISLLAKFTNENQGIIFQAINENKLASFEDNLFELKNNWKMIPLKNSKEEFSNMVFIGAND